MPEPTADLAEALQRRVLRLDGLVAAAATINSSLDRRTVLKAVMGQMSGLLDCEAASIILVDAATNELVIEVSTDIPLDGLPDSEKPRFPKGCGIAGQVMESGESLNIPDVSQDPRHFGEVDAKTGFVTRSLLAVPLCVKDRSMGVLEALNRRDGRPFDGEDQALFEAFADLVALAIENAQLYRRGLEQERLAQELRTARDIQLGLMPNESPSMAGFEIAGRCVPAYEVGGDYFTYLWLDEACMRLAFVVADVSGKGLAAAMVTMRFNEILRYEGKAQTGPEAILTGLDASLQGRIGLTSFVTGCLGVLDLPARSVRLANAAHPYACHYLARKDEVRQVGSSGLPMGIVLPGEKTGGYPEVEVAMSPGDALVLYSDGIVEAQDAKEEFYEDERLIEAIRREKGKGARALAEEILRDVETFRGEMPPMDDMTVVVLRRIGE